LAPDGVAIRTPEPKATEVVFDMDHISCKRAASLCFKTSTDIRTWLRISVARETDELCMVSTNQLSIRASIS
jgi:hypothetical protein